MTDETQKETPILNGEKPPERDEKGLFLPGSSGGPGRRPGSVSITAMIKKKLEEVPVGQIKSHLEFIVETMLEKAIVQKDITILKEIWHYVDGMPSQPLTLNADKETLEDLTVFFRNIAKPKEDEIIPSTEK